MDNQEIIKYIMAQKKVTIPEVQHKFSLPYSEVRHLFSELQSGGQLENVDGLIFEWRATDAEEAEEVADTDAEDEEDDDDDIPNIDVDEDDDDYVYYDDYDDDDEDIEDIIESIKAKHGQTTQDDEDDYDEDGDEDDEDDDYYYEDEDDYEDYDDSVSAPFDLQAQLSELGINPDCLEIDDEEAEDASANVDLTEPELIKTLSVHYNGIKRTIKQIKKVREQEAQKPLNVPDSTMAITYKLNSFGIDVQLSDVVEGATVTRYVFKVLSSKTPLSAIARYATDIRECVHSACDVRIVPHGDSNKVAIEIVNADKSTVTLSSILQSEEFKNATGNLCFALGEDLARNKLVVDLSKLPHLLVTGQAGSGKSTLLHNVILSFAQKYTPNQVRFLLVDEKQTEFMQYAGMPHLLTPQIVSTTGEMINALNYLIEEMERRYVQFKEKDVTNLAEYNKKTQDKLPYLVLVVDDFALFMKENKAEFESKVIRLAQKSRAAGIHLVLATQSSYISVVTGAMRSNFPARIGFKSTSRVFSFLSIGHPGCEYLVCQGDALYMDATRSEPKRLQVAYVGVDEISQIMQQFNKYPCNFYDVVQKRIFGSCDVDLRKRVEQKIANGEVDSLCKRALRLCLEENDGRASIAFLQRNLRIGFNRAGRIMDSLQQMGLVEQPSPAEPTYKPLHVLITRNDLDTLFPDFPE